MPDRLIITFILKVLSLCWVVCVAFFFFKRWKKRCADCVAKPQGWAPGQRFLCYTMAHRNGSNFFPPIRKWVVAVQFGVVKSGTYTSFLNEIFMHVGEHEENIAMPFCEMSHSCFPLISFPWFNDVSLRLVRTIATILGTEKLTYKVTVTNFTL